MFASVHLKKILNTEDVIPHCHVMEFQPLTNPTAKPAETPDTSGIPIFYNVPKWVTSIVLEACVNASTQLTIKNEA